MPVTKFVHASKFVLCNLQYKSCINNTIVPAQTRPLLRISKPHLLYFYTILHELLTMLQIVHCHELKLDYYSSSSTYNVLLMEKFVVVIKIRHIFIIIIIILQAKTVLQRRQLCISDEP